MHRGISVWSSMGTVCRTVWLQAWTIHPMAHGTGKLYDHHFKPWYLMSLTEDMLMIEDILGPHRQKIHTQTNGLRSLGENGKT